MPKAKAKPEEQKITPKKQTPSNFSFKFPIKAIVPLVLLLLIFIGFFLLPVPSPHSPQQNNSSMQGPLTLEFKQAMNKGSVEKNLHLIPEIKGQWSWDGRKKINFTPSESLTIKSIYRLELGSEAKSWYGKSLKQDYVFEFTVSGPPKVIFANPNSNPNDENIDKESATPLQSTDLKQPVTVLFDQPMNWDKNKDKTLLTTEPELKGEFKFLGERAFQFIPEEWPGKSTLKLSVPAGLVAKNGLETQEVYQWQFNTPGQKIIHIEPNPQLPIEVGQTFEIQFKMPVNLDDIRPGDNVQLFPSNDLNAGKEQQRDGFFNTEVTYKEKDPLTLLFKPVPSFQPNTDYELLFKKGLAGLEEDFKFNFHTGAVNVETPIQATSPLLPEALESFPAHLAPSFVLKKKLQAPLAVELCKLPLEINPFLLPQGEITPCSKPSSAMVDTVPQDHHLDLKALYPNEPWGNGLYWIVAKDARGEKEFRLALLSDTVLIVKRAGDDVLVWALDRLTHEPVARTEIKIFAPDGKELARGVTDGSGIFKRNQALTPTLYVLATKALEGENRWSIATDQWPVFSQSNGLILQNLSELYLMTNKNEVTPGETLKIKGLWRIPGQRGYLLPWAGEITLKLLDENKKEVFSQIFPMKEKASFDGDFVLPKTLSEGLYELQGFDGTKALSTLPTWVKVRNESSSVLRWVKSPDLSSDKPNFKLEWLDGSGLPVPHGKGQWVLYEHNPFNPLNTQILAQGILDFDAKGQARFTVDLSKENPLQSNTTYSLDIQAENDNLPLNLTHTFQFNPIQYPLSLEIKNGILEENTALQGFVIYDENVPSLTGVELVLRKKEDEKVFWKRAIELKSSPQSFDYNDLILPSHLSNGIYQLQVMQGNKAMSEPAWVYVVKEKTQALQEGLVVFLNRDKSEVNSKNKLLLNVPNASSESPKTVLLAYEQAGILDYDVVEAEAPLNVIEFNVQPNMSPGVYISAFTIGFDPSQNWGEIKKESEVLEVQKEALKQLDPLSPEFKEKETALKEKELTWKTKQTFAAATQIPQINSSQTYLPVSETRKSLQIKLNLETAPSGENEKENKAMLNVQVLDENANPVMATLSLALRPKSHFFLSPMDYFLSLPSLNVSTHSNLLLNSKQVSSPQARQAFKNLLQPFLPQSSLVFEPILNTDETGKLNYEFSLPQNAGEWEFVAFANTQENSWGNARMDLPQKETVSVKPILPMFLTAGDETELWVEIKNNSSQKIESPLTLNAPDLEVKNPSPIPVLLEPGELGTFSWPIRVKRQISEKATVSLSFNGKEYEFPLELLLNENTQMKSEEEMGFAWLGLNPSEKTKSFSEFEQGQSYPGKIVLINLKEVATPPLEEGMVEAPFEVSLALPAGLTFVKWQEEEQKGLSLSPSPLAAFESIHLSKNRLVLKTQNLPIGVYELNFEARAAWPGLFNAPSLKWDQRLLNWEQGRVVKVN